MNARADTSGGERGAGSCDGLAALEERVEERRLIAARVLDAQQAGKPTDVARGEGRRLGTKRRGGGGEQECEAVTAPLRAPPESRQESP